MSPMRRDDPNREDTRLIFPDKTFLGVSETDIIALERESRPETTTRWKMEDGSPPD